MMVNNPTSGIFFFNGVRWIDVTYVKNEYINI